MWTYSRPSPTSPFEIGVPLGGATSLRPHLHRRTQILVLTEGARQMRITQDEVVVRAGEALMLPPGTIHAALASEHPWSGFNLCLDPAVPTCDAPCIVAVFGLPRRRKRTDPHDVLDAVAAGTFRWTGARVPSRVDPIGCRETCVRRFARATGLPPAAHARMVRLDRARDLIARGTSPAEAAATTGFADQSHLGRLFREGYGTTPARYAAGT